MKKYSLKYGCKEWQDSEEFDSLGDVEKEIASLEESGWAIGLYSATYAYLEKDGETIQEYDTGYSEDDL